MVDTGHRSECLEGNSAASDEAGHSAGHEGLQNTSSACARVVAEQILLGQAAQSGFKNVRPNAFEVFGLDFMVNAQSVSLPRVPLITYAPGGRGAWSMATGMQLDA